MGTSIEGTMTLGQAAQLLAVSEQRVQQLGREGRLTYVARGLLDSSSVRDYQAIHQGRHTRGWSKQTAWAAIALLSQRQTDWLGQAQTSRLGQRLRGTGAENLVSATRNRAQIGRFTGHSSAAGRLSKEAVVRRRQLPGIVGRDLDLETDYYIDARDASRLKQEYGLRADATGRYVLRSVEMDDDDVTFDLVTSLMDEDVVLTALDSASSADPRERGVANNLLENALARFRERV